MTSDGDKYADYVLYMNTAVVEGDRRADVNPESDRRLRSPSAATSRSISIRPTASRPARWTSSASPSTKSATRSASSRASISSTIYGGPNGPGYGALGYDLNDTSIFSALDMFRYSNDPTISDRAVRIELRSARSSYFSIDGGATALFGNTFSTGTLQWRRQPGFALEGRRGRRMPAARSSASWTRPSAIAQMGDVTGARPRRLRRDGLEPERRCACRQRRAIIRRPRRSSRSVSAARVHLMRLSRRAGR